MLKRRRTADVKLRHVVILVHVLHVYRSHIVLAFILAHTKLFDAVVK